MVDWKKKKMSPKIGLDSFQKVCWAEIVNETYIIESENQTQKLPTFLFGWGQHIKSKIMDSKIGLKNKNNSA